MPEALHPAILPRVREDSVSDLHLFDRDHALQSRDRNTGRETNPAGNARLLADRRLRGLWIDPDDLGTGALGRAERNALEMAALRLTSVLEHGCDAHGNSMRRELFKRMTVGAGSAETLSDSHPSVACDAMIPGGRANPRQMRQAMKRPGIEQEQLDDVEEVIIRTATKEYVIRDANVTAMTAQGQKIWTVVGEPIVRDRAGAKKAEGATSPTIPDEDVKLVAEKAGVSEEEARKALEDAGGEPAEAIIRLMSR